MQGYLGRLIAPFSTRQAQAALRGEAVDMVPTLKTKAQAQARAAQASPPAAPAADPRERIKAILDLDEAKGSNESQAMAIALETDLSVDQAKAVLAAAPKPGPARATIAERMAEAGNLTDMGTMPRATAAAGAHDWAGAVAKVNARNGFERPGVSDTVPSLETTAGQPAPISARAPRAEAGPAAAPAAPSAPASTAPAGAPAFNYPQVGDPDDNLRSLSERLPAGRPRETFLDLGETRSELHAIVRDTMEKLNEARERRHAAHTAVRRLTEAEFASGLTLSEADDEVIRARAKVKAADAAIAAAQARYDAASARWKAVGARHRIAVDYVSRVGESSLRAWKGKPAAPRNGEAVAEAVARARETLAKLGAELHTVRSAPLPVAEVWPQVKAEVERLAESGQPDVLQCLEQGRPVKWPTARPYVAQTGVASPAHGSVEINDGFSLAVWLNKGQLLKKLEAELRAGADDANAISTEDRRKREDELLDAILSAERVDIDLVQAAAGAVEHRPAEQIDPRALLAIEGPAPRDA